MTHAPTVAVGRAQTGHAAVGVAAYLALAPPGSAQPFGLALFGRRTSRVRHGTTPRFHPALAKRLAVSPARAVGRGGGAFPLDRGARAILHAPPGVGTVCVRADHASSSAEGTAPIQAAQRLAARFLGRRHTTSLDLVTAPFPLARARTRVFWAGLCRGARGRHHSRQDGQSAECKRHAGTVGDMGEARLNELNYYSC